MTILNDGERIVEIELSIEEIQRAVAFLIKERERVKLQGRRRRQALKEANPPAPKEPTEPKKYYIPTGRPRGRPRKTSEEVPAEETSSEISPA